MEFDCSIAISTSTNMSLTSLWSFSMATKHYAVLCEQCEGMQYTETHTFTHILCTYAYKKPNTHSVMHAQLYETALGLTVDTHANTYSLFTHAYTHFDMLTLRYSCALSKITHIK